MVIITFPDDATEKRGLGFLMTRFSGRLLRDGIHIVPEAALEALAAEGIPCSSGYASPLYRNPMFLDPALGRDYGIYPALCPNAERACSEAVWLEHRLLLGEPGDIDDIAEAVEKIHLNRYELANKRTTAA